MQQIMCFEVLFATILLWVAVFGLADLVMELVEARWKKASFYVGLALSVLVFLLLHKNVSVCGLM